MQSPFDRNTGQARPFESEKIIYRRMKSYQEKKRKSPSLNKSYKK